MPVLTSKNVLSDIVRWEINPEYCRKIVTLSPTTKALELGSVLGVVASGPTAGQYVQATSGDTGITPKAILLTPVEISTETQNVVVLARMALIVPGALKWDASFNTPAKQAAALVALEAATGISTATQV